MAINWWFITAFIGFWYGWYFTVIKLKDNNYENRI